MRHPRDTYKGTCPYHGDCVEGLTNAIVGGTLHSQHCRPQTAGRRRLWRTAPASTSATCGTCPTRTRYAAVHQMRTHTHLVRPYTGLGVRGVLHCAALRQPRPHGLTTRHCARRWARPCPCGGTWRADSAAGRWRATETLPPAHDPHAAAEAAERLCAHQAHHRFAHALAARRGAAHKPTIRCWCCSQSTSTRTWSTRCTTRKFVSGLWRAAGPAGRLTVRARVSARRCQQRRRRGLARARARGP
jgi:hypothetical protein